MEIAGMRHAVSSLSEHQTKRDAKIDARLKLQDELILDLSNKVTGIERDIESIETRLRRQLDMIGDRLTKPEVQLMIVNFERASVEGESVSLDDFGAFANKAQDGIIRLKRQMVKYSSAVRKLGEVKPTSGIEPRVMAQQQEPSQGSPADNQSMVMGLIDSLSKRIEEGISSAKKGLLEYKKEIDPYIRGFGSPANMQGHSHPIKSTAREKNLALTHLDRIDLGMSLICPIGAKTPKGHVISKDGELPQTLSKVMSSLDRTFGKNWMKGDYSFNGRFSWKVKGVLEKLSTPIRGVKSLKTEASSDKIEVREGSAKQSSEKRVLPVNQLCRPEVTNRHKHSFVKGKSKVLASGKEGPTTVVAGSELTSWRRPIVS
jgi:hypothetical protein